jgi:hypothetical protein
MHRFSKRPTNKKYDANPIICKFPYKKKNYKDYIEKAKSCFSYLQNIEWNSAERLTITNEPFQVKGLPKMTQDDFSFNCPESIFSLHPDLRIPGKIYVSINSIDTDYDNMNIFSDLFNEEPRMKANVIGKTSPFDYWEQNCMKIIRAARTEHYTEDPSNYQLREKLYEMHYNKRGECTTFRPSILYAIIKLFGWKSMLDPSSGWGDRLFAALAAGIEYTGVDPNTALIPGYQEIQKYFDPEGKSTMVCSGFENFNKPGLQVDGVFTSPAYFNIETYSQEATQSINKFDSERAWTENFLFVLFDKSIEYTKVGGHVILNIEMMNTNTYVYDLIEYSQTKPNVTYCGMLTYKGSRHTAHAAIFVFRKNN